MIIHDINLSFNAALCLHQSLASTPYLCKFQTKPSFSPEATKHHRNHLLTHISVCLLIVLSYFHTIFIIYMPIWSQHYIDKPQEQSIHSYSVYCQHTYLCQYENLSLETFSPTNLKSANLAFTIQSFSVINQGAGQSSPLTQLIFFLLSQTERCMFYVMITSTNQKALIFRFNDTLFHPA